MSVVTASYNHAPFLPARIDSILGQSYRDFEWIIVDDGSTDGSQEILARAAESDRRVRLVLRDDNRGMARTTREGIDLSSGELVHRAESDDACHPTFLARTVAAFDANPSVVLASTATRRMDSQGRVSGGLLQPRRDAVFPGAVAFARLLRRNYIAGPATLFSRAAHDSVGGFGAPPFQIACDHHLSLRLAVLGDIAYVADRLYCSRSHDGNLSGRLGRDLDLRDFEREGYELVRDAVRFAAALRPELSELERYAVRRTSLTSGAALYDHVRRAGDHSLQREVLDVIERNDGGVTTSLAWRATLRREATMALLRSGPARLASWRVPPNRRR